MAKCQIKGCTRDVTFNPKTGRPNMLCTMHYKESIGESHAGHGTGKHASSAKQPRKKPAAKPKVAVKGPELFVLRGHTLTINYTGKTKHVNVDRLTRAVKYNDDRQGTSGKTFHYVIDVKQGIEIVANVLFDSKQERDREFEKLQSLLSGLY
jgi:hypothetical protein